MTAESLRCHCGAVLRSANLGPECWQCEHHEEEVKRAREWARQAARTRDLVRAFYAARDRGLMVGRVG